MSNSLHRGVCKGLQHTGLPCPPLSPGVCSNTCPLSWWCYLTISSSVIPFSTCLQSFPVSGSFLMSQFFASGGQTIGVLASASVLLMNQLYASGDQIIGASASASILPMNVQDWFPSGFTGLMSLQSKELSRVFSKTTVQKHQFFSIQYSLWCKSHIHTWLLEKP